MLQSCQKIATELRPHCRFPRSNRDFIFDITFIIESPRPSSKGVEVRIVWYDLDCGIRSYHTLRFFLHDDSSFEERLAMHQQVNNINIILRAPPAGEPFLPAFSAMMSKMFLVSDLVDRAAWRDETAHSTFVCASLIVSFVGGQEGPGYSRAAFWQKAYVHRSPLYPLHRPAFFTRNPLPISLRDPIYTYEYFLPGDQLAAITLPGHRPLFTLIKLPLFLLSYSTLTAHPIIQYSVSRLKTRARRRRVIRYGVRLYMAWIAGNLSSLEFTSPEEWIQGVMGDVYAHTRQEVYRMRRVMDGQAARLGLCRKLHEAISRLASSMHNSLADRWRRLRSRTRGR